MRDAKGSVSLSIESGSGRMQLSAISTEIKHDQLAAEPRSTTSRTNMKTNLKLVFAATVVSILTACGGGGGGSGTGGTTTQAAAGFSQTYAASATAGEVLQYSVDTSALTYSYTITKSIYGCEVVSAPCHSGSGTLIKNGDGTYSPSESPASKIFPIQNGLLIGHARMNLGGTLRDVPILGVSNPATTGPGIEGTFNFVSLQCGSKSYGVYTGCQTYRGSVAITSTGASTASFVACVGANIATGTGGCTSTSTGTMTHTSGGVWQMLRAGSSNSNYMIGFTAPNGQKVGVIDFNDNGGYGFGQGVISTVANIVPATDVYGTYFAKSSNGGNAVFTVDAAGSHVNGTTLAVNYNSPWAGMATVSNGGTAILAGTGVYAYMNPSISSSYFEIGIRLN